MVLHTFFKPRTSINFISSQLRLGSVISRYLSMDVEMSSADWRGVPLSEIIGSQSPWGAPEFPLISPSHNHTVLFHIPNNGDIGDRPLKPQIGQDKWDGDHVRMPCSNKSLYPVEDINGDSCLRKRWEMIEEALRRPILNSEQLANTILSYNTKFRTIWKFRALHTLFNEHLEEEESQYFFTVTLPQIAQLALDLPKLIQTSIPLLKQHKNHTISMTQYQIASLLANAFFCTFPRRNTSKRTSEYASYPHINFTILYECAPHDDVLEKLTCICHYFRRVCAKAPLGVVSFSRRSVAPRRLPAWGDSAAPLASLPLHVDPTGRIEDAHGLLQMDFANKYLGGGVLGHGCVQEEIRFAICPELLACMLVTEMLRPNEALLIIGCERYSQYSGYGRTFRWCGDHCDVTPRDSSGRRRVGLLAVDALPYPHPAHQYREPALNRELNKAWVGFTFYSDPQLPLQYPGLATGNWGCGAFGGTPDLKCLLQLMAAAEARRPLAYYTFGDAELRDQIVSVYNLLARHHVTVGQLYKLIVMFSRTKMQPSRLHAYLQQALLDEEQRQKQIRERPLHVDNALPPSKPNDIATSTLNPSNDSPDLFSQDEDSPTDAHTNIDIYNESTSKNDTSANKMADSVNKMENKSPQTKRLFDALNKFDDENGKLNLNTENSSNITSRYFDGQTDDIMTSDSDIEPNISVASSSELVTSKPKAADGETKMADSENKMAATSSLMNELQRMDEENTSLSGSVPDTSPVFNFKVRKQSPDAAMESDKSESFEVKKKIAKKITDYFSKR